MSDKEYLVSIIVPAYNAINTINETIASVLRQDYEHIELLIIDGNSTDGSVEMLQERAQKDNFVLVSEKDRGVYDAMNKGIGLAKGDWLLFLGADDMLYDDTVVRDVMAQAARQQVDVIYGNVWLARDQKIYAGAFNRPKLLRQNISHQAIFYRKNLFGRFGLYDLKYRIAADYVFNLSWFADRDVRHLYMDRIVARFAQDGLSSVQRDLVYKKDRTRLVRKYFPFHLYLYALLIVPWDDFFRKKVPSFFRKS